MTMDGIFDHTAGLPDEQVHDHYTTLLSQGDAILYGRTTYELMEFWRTIVVSPSDDKSMNDFAMAIDKIPKIVFTHTLKKVEWRSATIATRDLKEIASELKQQPGKDILVGSRSLIIQLLELKLIDELQICVYPVVAGKGRGLFENFSDRTIFKLVNTKIFQSGAVILYYQPKNN